MANVYEYVNGELLNRFINKKVGLIGFVTSVAPNQQSFEVRAADDVVVKVNLKRPLDHPLSGYVMVMYLITAVIRFIYLILCFRCVAFPKANQWLQSLLTCFQTRNLM